MQNTLHILRWFWRTSRSFRLQAVINVLVGLVTVATDLSFIAATKMAIDIATHRSQGSLQLAAALLIGIIAMQILLGFARRWIAALLGVKAQNRMQRRLFARLMESEWQGMEFRHSGDVLNRLERDVQDVTTVITETLPSVFCVAIRLMAAFGYLYSMDPRLACVLVVVAPAFVVLSRIYVRKMRSITREVRNTDSLIQSLLTESIQHRMVLKTLERTGTMAERLEQTQARLRRQVRHRTLFSSTSAALLSAGFGAGYLITFLWGVNRLYDETITYGMMLAFIQLVGQIQGPFRDMTRFIPIVIGALTAGERLMELEEMPLEEQGESVHFLQGAGIRLTDVTFSYDRQKRTIIQKLSCDFPPGSTTAIVGETGAGKTTLIRLILALLQPQAGRVEIYDPEKALKVSPLTRCNLVYVPQGNTLFSGTVRDNLLLGNPTATEEEMREALRTACADFVLQRPEGLDTLCGEQGSGMSEGQAQRVSIARALLRQGSILLLDEATSALDMETEQALLRNLRARLSARQTLIFITHRAAVLEHCTQVLRLERSS